MEKSRHHYLLVRKKLSTQDQIHKQSEKAAQ